VDVEGKLEEYAGAASHRGSGPVLLEREGERAELEALIADARAGEGRVLFVEGEAGIGKTRLLDEARALAMAAEVRALSARGGELERDFGFGIVRGLLEPLLAGAAEGEREELFAGPARLAEPVFTNVRDGLGDSPDTTQATIHGLYWLLANASHHRPLLLAVDDLQWADAPSLRFLDYLARRIDGLPLGVVITTRTGEPSSHPDLSRQLMLDAPTPILRPAPLSPTAVERLIKGELGEEAGAELCAACHEATAGNPFLVSELAAELSRDGQPPSQIRAEAVRVLGPERIAAALLMRIGRVDPEAPRLAAAVAVLGAEANLEDAAELAGLDTATARSLASALVEAQVFGSGAQLRFIHPIARTAILEEMPAARRSSLHRDAAQVLSRRGADPSEIAVHLLATDPVGDARPVQELTKAARAALAAGAPEVGARYLRRALSEPPADDLRPALLLALGRACACAGGLEDAVEALRLSLDETDDADAHAEVALELGHTLALAGEPDRAMTVLREARDRLGPKLDERAIGLETELALVAHTGLPASDWLGRFAAVVEQAEGDGLAARNARAFYAYAAAAACRQPAEKVAEIARSAVAPSTGADNEPIFLQAAAAALAMAGRFGEALGVLDRMLEVTRERGDELQFALACLTRTWIALRAGRVEEAEADARTGIDAGPPGMLDLRHATANLVNALIERGELELADAELDARGLSETREEGNLGGAMLFAVRGRLRLLRGRPQEALADLELCRDMARSAGMSNPAFADWRRDAALAHLALGDAAAAQRISAEDLKVARAFGAPRELGIALRTAGLLAGGDPGLELLGESVAVLDASEARLAYVRSLVEQGSAMRRAGRRRESRETLARGLDAASKLGARAIAKRARAELVAAGAKPRRERLDGPASLTPSERRVAGMAAEGMTNKQIAQALFVTLRTVEMHLSNSYGKLGIASRRELPDALRAPDR
jgi:DNA-binding CsgD family transcriptional regulator